MGIRKYIGDRNFYKIVLGVALPIMIQNFITNFVSMLDNLMVGSLGTEQMSGVSIVNQIVFVFNLAVFGLISGAGIFTAQFYGKNDIDGVRHTFRYKLISVVILFVAAMGILLVFKSDLILLFLHRSENGGNINATLDFAGKYFDVILWGLFPFCIAQCFSLTLRETGETVAPMIAGFVAVLVNSVFNYFLIFGKFGFPNMGVKGAAVATVLSRYVECIYIIVYAVTHKEKFKYFKNMFRNITFPRELYKSITIKGTPLLINEFLWSCGITLLSIGYSLHGLPVVAAYSISSTVINLANIAFLTLGSSIGIIVGKLLGAGKTEDAVDTSRKLTAFSVMISIFVGIIVLAVGNKIPEFYNTTMESKKYAVCFISVCACCLPIHAFANACYFTLRSGGKTIVTFLFDSVFTLAVSVPCVFLLYNTFKLNILIIFPIIQSLDIIKDIVGYILVKKRVWVNNIVE